MNEAVIKLNNIVKNYRKTTVLNKTCLTVKKGSIYGLIGENGAGKTTIMRILSGLTEKTHGSIELFGESNDSQLRSMRKRIGVLIESPCFFADKTAYENLEILRIVRGIPEKNSVDKALKSVSLHDTGSKRVKNFSLGMKQRLGIAMALLGEPELLILDEPINGVDPTGIIEIRDILKKLNKEREMTILISSHILSELDQLATDFGIIHRGKILKEISSQEINDCCKKYVHVKVNDASKSARIISDVLKTDNFEILPDNKIKIFEHIDHPEIISKTLCENGIVLYELMSYGSSLEEYYSDLIGGISHV